MHWFAATKKRKGRYQEVDASSKSDAFLLCEICNNSTNPCFYDAVCLDDGKCHCTIGSSGRLCAVAPVQNGLCNPYFNKPEFNYDGGDCCMDTCISTEKYKCGRDATGIFDTGYDNCISYKENRFECEDCWINSMDSFNVGALLSKSDTSVTLTSNGQVMAVGESWLSSVRIFDRDGSQRKQRVMELSGNEGSKFGSWVEVSAPSNTVNSISGFSPVTVAIQSTDAFHVYDWDETSFSWVEVTPDLLSFDMSIPVSIGLCQEGRTFAVLFEDCLFLFSRENRMESWMNSQICVGIQIFSLSKIGNNLFTLANELEDDTFLKHFILSEAREDVHESSRIQCPSKILSFRVSYRGALHCRTQYHSLIGNYKNQWYLLYLRVYYKYSILGKNSFLLLTQM